MTRLSGFGDDGARGAGDALPLALRIADAVDSLAHLWATAGQGAGLRLSPHQLRALRILESGPGLNLTALAEGMEIGLPTASRLCDRLEAAGLVERGLHPHRRREVQLNLTGHGRQVLEEVASNRSRALATVLAAMPPTEREALGRGMRAFLTAREDTAGNGGPSGTDSDGAGRKGRGPDTDGPWS
ncbi:MarR family winged helix-turn-helix transcriptional regulator [Streptomyces sp. NPDC101112]|uniref:MarR family winged helix-turn-helix transcriptional regulator n=1 Tax=Streptomyces sp. NPDC101112 TaxID=3366105 RepID=UPI00382AFB09